MEGVLFWKKEKKRRSHRYILFSALKKLVEQSNGSIACFMVSNINHSITLNQRWVIKGSL